MHMRRYKRSFKNNFFIIFLIIVLCISVGYAAISRVLTINGNSEVIQNTWDIHFDNVQVKDGSIKADSIPVIDTTTKTSISFNVMLNLPGDFYEFTVDVINAGTIDAMLESITKTPDLSEAQAKYLNYIIEYENGEQLAAKQLVKKEEFVRLKVRVEYSKDLNAEDLPTTTETLNLAFSVNYVQADETGIVVTNNGAKIQPTANGSLDDIGTIVTIGTEQFYTIGTEGDNVKLLSMYNLYVGGSSYSGSWYAYGESATGMQNSNMIGKATGLNTYRGTTAFSNDTQKGTKYSDYNGSLAEVYVNAYKIKLKENFGIEVVEARLITKEELVSDKIGCTSSCEHAPSFIYSTSYWTGTASDSYYIWNVGSDGVISIIVYNSIFIGVRPVIVIPKSEIIIEPKLIEFTIEGTTYQAEEGMTWEEWVDSEYNNESYIIVNEQVYTSLGDKSITNGSDFISKDDIIDPNIQYSIYSDAYHGQ